MNIYAVWILIIRNALLASVNFNSGLWITPRNFVSSAKRNRNWPSLIIYLICSFGSFKLLVLCNIRILRDDESQVICIWYCFIKVQVFLHSNLMSHCSRRAKQCTLEVVFTCWLPLNWTALALALIDASSYMYDVLF